MLLINKKNNLEISPASVIEEEKSENWNFYLPKISPNYEYTLVLDLDETLIHYFYVKNILFLFYFHKTETTGMFFIRPHMMYFLEELYKKYEIVIFTAATKEVKKYYKQKNILS